MNKKLKTNIKCGGCIATVTPYLNKAVGEGNWQVDTSAAEKWLTVPSENSEAAKNAVEAAGFSAQEA